jgi:uncharacterized integral membrane protein
MRFGFIISLVFAIIVAIFGIQNSTVISVNFFSTSINISLALLIFTSTIIGAIIVSMLGLKKELSLSHGNKLLTKKVKNYENEIEILKDENVSFKNENENLKNKVEDLELKIKTITDEMNSFKAENQQLNKD